MLNAFPLQVYIQGEDVCFTSPIQHYARVYVASTTGKAKEGETEERERARTQVRREEVKPMFTCR